MALNAAISRVPDPRDPYTAGVPLGWEACNNGSGVACSPNAPLNGKSRPNLANIDYTSFLNPHGLSGVTLGMTRSGVDSAPPQVQAGFYAAIDAMGNAGATILDLDAENCAGVTTSACVSLQTPVDLFANNAGAGEFLVLLYDFKNDLASYFSTRVGVPVAGGTLHDAIDFDNAHAAEEMPYFGQEIFFAADALNTTDPTLPQAGFGMSYNDALKTDQLLGANIDATLAQYNLKAIVAPTDSPGWTTDLILSDHFLFASSGIAGPPGYPIINVPAANVLGMPMGVSFIGTAFSEPTLISLASGFEAATHARFEPTFTGDVTKANTSGTTLVRPPRTTTHKKTAPHHM
jgi:amidase